MSNKTTISFQVTDECRKALFILSRKHGSISNYLRNMIEGSLFEHKCFTCEYTVQDNPEGFEKCPACGSDNCTGNPEIKKIFTDAKKSLLF